MTPDINTDDTYCRCLLTQTRSMLAVPSRWFTQHTGGYAPIFLRLLLAYEFAEAGLEKYHGENWFANLSFPFPFNLLSAEASWNMAMGLELLGPLALVLGLATRFFSVALMVLTVVAIAAVHWPAHWQTLAELWQGYAITDKGYGNYKLPLLYLLMLASLFCSGAGWLSVDYWLGRKFFKG
ncbi:HvfX family Cu-binding RiPP maturation protein [Methylovulum psychrotolerans]|uniref:HvfX family Cu-binding RiPP maturation protein n=1 Tax=Methylovulum psychrotolerans TaxID=1704499 RepID=UPI001E614398|nr:DoxX family protein [Methylovulum psychrotolerans]